MIDTSLEPDVTVRIRISRPGSSSPNLDDTCHMQTSHEMTPLFLVNQ